MKQKFSLFSFIILVAISWLQAQDAPACFFNSEANRCEINISSTEEFQNLANIQSSCMNLCQGAPFYVTLTEDLIFSEDILDSNCTANFSPIETFRGTFDGNNHTISGLCLKDTNPLEATLYPAIFNNVNQASFKNLTLKNIVSYSESGGNTAVLINYLNDGLEVENIKIQDVTLISKYYATAALLVAEGFSEDTSSSQIFKSIQAKNINYLISGEGTIGGFVGSIYNDLKNVQFTESSLDLHVTQIDSENEKPTSLTFGGFIAQSGKTIFEKDTLNIEFTLLNSKLPMETITIGGLAGVVSNRISINQVQADGFIKSIGETTPDDFAGMLQLGGFVGLVETNDSIKVQNSEIKTDILLNQLVSGQVYLGSVFGNANSPSMIIHDVVYSGDISVESLLGDIYSIGGFVGSYNSTFENYVSSSSTANFKNLEMSGNLTYSFGEGFYPSYDNSVGGVFGTCQLSDSYPFDLIFDEIKVNGSISVNLPGTFVKVGGIVANATNNSPYDFVIQNSEVSAPISVTSYYTLTGGLIGEISSNTSSFTNNNVSAPINIISDAAGHSEISASSAVAIGGVVGKNGSAYQNFLNNKVSSKISLDYDVSFAENAEILPRYTEGSFLGGVAGQLTNSMAEVSSDYYTIYIDSSEFTGSIKVLNAFPEISLGGIVGDIAMHQTSIRQTKAQNLNDTLISLSKFSNDNVFAMPAFVGGLIGKTESETDNLILQEVFVEGNLEIASTTMTDQVDILSGLIGFNPGTTRLFAGYFSGNLFASKELSDIYGLFSSTENNVSDGIDAAYAVDFAGNAELLTNHNPNNYNDESHMALAYSADSVVYITNSRPFDSLALGTPAFAAQLNSNSPVWFHDPKAKEGLPQLLSFHHNVLPTVGVYFYEKDEVSSSSSASEEEEIYSSSSFILSDYYTNKSGKLAYKNDGTAIDFKLLPPSILFDSKDSALITFYKNLEEQKEGIQDLKIWKNDSNLIYPYSVSYHETSARIVFGDYDEYGEFKPLEKKENVFFESTSAQFLKGDSTPKIITQNETQDFVLYNQWEHINSGFVCLSTDCMWEILSNFTSETQTYDIELRPYVQEGELYQHFISLDLMHGFAYETQIFNETLESEIFQEQTVERIQLPRVSKMVIHQAYGIPEQAIPDSLIVSINDSIQYEVALGDTISLPKEQNAFITIYPKVKYNIHIDIPNVASTLFQTGDFPESYIYRGNDVRLPNLATLENCLSNYVYDGEPLYYDEQTNEFVLTPRDSGDISVYAEISRNCIPEIAYLTLSPDSGIVTTISHYGNVLTPNQNNKIAFPKIGKIRFDIQNTPIADEFSVDSLTLNGIRLENPEIFYLAEDGVLEIFVQEQEDLFKIQKAILAMSGSAIRYTITAEEIKTFHPIQLKVQLFKADSSLLQDTLLTANAESGKEYAFEYWPLPAGNYTAKASLFTSNHEEIDSVAIKVSNILNENLATESWSMISLANLDTSKWKPEENENVTLYSWNESQPVGEYWQYERLEKASDINKMKGYWFFVEDSTVLPLLASLTKPEEDSITWKLENHYSGWNLLSNPYSWDIALNHTNAFLDAENAEEPAWIWNAQVQNYEPVQTLKANSAFFIHTEESKDFSVANKPVFQENDSMKVLAKNAKANSSKKSWSLRLKLIDENSKTGDLWNVIGVASSALSIEEPPVGMKQMLSLSTQGSHRALAKSIKQSSDSLTWVLNLKADGPRKALFKVEGLNALLEKGYRAELIFEGKVIDVVSEEGVHLNLNATSKQALFRVLPKANLVSPGNIQNLRYTRNGSSVVVSFNRNNSDQATSTLRFLDSRGRIISFTSEKTSFGENSISLEVPPVSGTFFLNLLVGNESKTLPIHF